MSVYITVGGVERSPLISSLSIGKTLDQQTTCDMEFLVEDSWRPVVGAAVEVWADALLEYSGTVDTVDVRLAGPGRVYVAITCVDHTAILGRRLAGEYAWTNVTAGQIVEDIVHRSLDGEGLFTSGILPGPNVAAFQTDYQTVAEALRQVAELVGYVARVTPDRVVRFHPPEMFDAPFEVDVADAKVASLRVEATREDYANRVLVRLEQGLLKGTVDTFSGAGRVGPSNDPTMALDGDRRPFDLSYRAQSIQRIVENGVGCSFGEEGTDGVEWWYTPGSQRIEFVNTMRNPLPSTTTVEVIYTAVTRTLAQRQNAAAIAERAAAEGGSGIYEVGIELGDAISVEDAGEYAQSLLDRRSSLSYVAHYQTDTKMQPLAAGLVPGLRQFIRREDLGANGYYLVRRVNISDLKLASGTFLRYEVEAVKGPIVGDAVSFFRQLAGGGGPPAGLLTGPEERELDSISDVTGLAAAVQIRRGRVLIALGGTAPNDDRFVGCNVWIETPAEGDPNPAAPTLPGQIFPQGVHPGEPSAPGEPRQWTAPLDVPVPPMEYLNSLAQPRVKWVLYAVAKGTTYENRLTWLSSLDPLGPAGASPAAVVEIDFTDYLAGIITDDELGEVTTTAAMPARTWQASGDLRLRALRADTAGYVPPYVGSSATLSIGQFLGVEVYWEQDGEPKRPLGLGSSPYTGNAQSDPPDNLGEIDVMIPRGYLSAGTHYLHLRSYGETRRLGYRPAERAARSSYWSIEVTQEELDLAPSTGVIPGAASAVVPFIRPGFEATKYFAGVRWTPPESLTDVAGWRFRARIRANADGTGDYYPTDGSWIPMGEVYQADAVEWVKPEELDRDTRIVYLQMGVAALNDRGEEGAWVNSLVVAPIPPAGPTAGQAAEIEFEITNPDKRAYGFDVTLVPPAVLGQIESYDLRALFFDAATGGAQVGLTDLTSERSIAELVTKHGPFPRPLPEDEAYAQMAGRFRTADGAVGEWFYSEERKLVTAAAAPAAPFVNESAGYAELRSGVHVWWVEKRIRLTGALEDVSWLDCELGIWSDAGRTTWLREWFDVGGLDPGATFVQGDPPETYIAQATSSETRVRVPIYVRTRIRARNVDGQPGPWVESATIAIPAAPGLDIREVDPVAVGPGVWYNPSTNKFEVKVDPATIVTDGSGRVTMSAESVVNRLGLTSFFSFDHTNSLKLDTLAANSLLGGNAVFLGTMIFTQGDAALTLSGSAATLTTPGQSFSMTSAGAVISAGGAQLQMTASWVRASAMLAQTFEIRAGMTDTANQVQLSPGTSYFAGAGVNFNCPVSFGGSVTGLTFSMISGSLPGHTHAQSEVTGLVDALAGKAAAAHNHDGDYAPLYYYAGQTVGLELYDLNQRYEALEARVTALE